MKKKYDVVATNGEYKDRQTGETKKRYVNVGSVFEDDQGRLSMKLDAFPVGQEWSGWLSFYEPKGREQQQPSQQQQPKLAQPSDDDDGDDIPF